LRGWKVLGYCRRKHIGCVRGLCSWFIRNSRKRGVHALRGWFIRNSRKRGVHRMRGKYVRERHWCIRVHVVRHGRHDRYRELVGGAVFVRCRERVLEQRRLQESRRVRLRLRCGKLVRTGQCVRTVLCVSGCCCLCQSGKCPSCGVRPVRPRDVQGQHRRGTMLEMRDSHVC